MTVGKSPHVFFGQEMLKPRDGSETVIRLKDERRLLFQDAESMFQRDEGRKRSFRKGKKSIEVWDLSGFEIDLDDILSGLKY